MSEQKPYLTPNWVQQARVARGNNLLVRLQFFATFAPEVLENTHPSCGGKSSPRPNRSGNNPKSAKYLGRYTRTVELTHKPVDVAARSLHGSSRYRRRTARFLDWQAGHERSRSLSLLERVSNLRIRHHTAETDQIFTHGEHAVAELLEYRDLLQIAAPPTASALRGRR